ncbi:MAG TPA: histidine--tRNA ligase [Bacteroidales bacterium]|nr:histidine--tRNA ligase [Bacteroidales bacterium]
MTRPSIPKGTRDFTPAEMVRRNYIFATIRKIFELFGYQPIETPALENLSTLLGKYGEEGDKLLFKILNSGNYLEGIQNAFPDGEEAFSPASVKALTLLITEKGLRYDLTVPFARFVVQHQHELTFPFKRYQIQPVWRADRPQKGRYREFFQCDVDVIGSSSLLNEAELIQIIDQVFLALGISVSIRVNNRKILSGIAEAVGASGQLTDLTTAMDKLDKVGLEKVLEELLSRGLSPESVEKTAALLQWQGSQEELPVMLTEFLRDSVTGQKGLQEMAEIMQITDSCGIKNQLLFDLKLARGLNYYTGTILEVSSRDAEIGSICGGGRYDDLTGIFGWEGVSGVGISFGADRIFDVMAALNLFPEEMASATHALFINFGEKEVRHCIQWASRLRDAGISTEIYPDPAKLKKQMEYAHRKNIPYVILAGEDEIRSGFVSLKKMKTGEQINLSPDLLTDHLRP